MASCLFRSFRKPMKAAYDFLLHYDGPTNDMGCRNESNSPYRRSERPGQLFQHALRPLFLLRSGLGFMPSTHSPPRLGPCKPVDSGQDLVAARANPSILAAGSPQPVQTRRSWPRALRSPCRPVDFDREIGADAQFSSIGSGGTVEICGFALSEQKTKAPHLV